MINTPIELDPDPEPDIRRSSSYHHSPPSPRTAPTTSNNQLPDSHHDGIPDPRIERPGAKRPLDDDTHRAKAVGGDAGAASAGQTEMNPSPPSILLDAQASTLRPNGLGPDVPVSRPTSNRPKVRDFAAQTANAAKSINIAEPLRRATEHLGRVVPAKREGPIDAPGGIPASLVYRPREVGMSNPRNAAGQAPGTGGPADVGSGIGGDEPPVPKKKKKLPSPTLKESIKVSQYHIMASADLCRTRSRDARSSGSSRCYSPYHGRCTSRTKTPWPSSSPRSCASCRSPVV